MTMPPIMVLVFAEDQEDAIFSARYAVHDEVATDANEAFDHFDDVDGGVIHVGTPEQLPVDAILFDCDGYDIPPRCLERMIECSKKKDSLGELWAVPFQERFWTDKKAA